MIRRLRSTGRFRTGSGVLPLFEAALRAKSTRVAKGNRTRRLNEMRHCRELMEAAPDYPLNLMVAF